MSNLTQRILTAVVLLAVFVWALIAANTGAFQLLTLLMIGAAGWEWSRLIGWTGWRAWASGVFCAACPVVVAFFAILAGDDSMRVLSLMLIVSLGAVCLFWVIGAPYLLRLGAVNWPALPRWLRWIIGMATLGVAWAALTFIYTEMGVNFLLSVLALVWAADIGAYAFGRALGGKLTGGRKLAPSISPGKTWEGAVGGFICVLLVGTIWIWLEPQPSSPSFYTTLWQRGPVWFFGALALLTAMSVVGDLFESLVKRAAGAKDSSQLLPGHGGVLDRIDALLPALPLAMMLMNMTDFPWLMKVLSGNLQ